MCKRTSGAYRTGEHHRYVIGHQHRKNPRLVRVDPAPGCWVWLGAAGADPRKSGHRYGTMRHLGRYVRAHRHYYEQAKGPIPEGLVIDHLCRNTLCVNPEHLEAVTQGENLRRAKPRRSKCDVSALDVVSP